MFRHWLHLVKVMEKINFISMIIIIIIIFILSYFYNTFQSQSYKVLYELQHHTVQDRHIKDRDLF